jgi:hypothetical protein
MPRSVARRRSDASTGSALAQSSMQHEWLDSKAHAPP